MGEFDVTIIGGGPAGIACALRSAELGLRTAVVDRSGFGHARVGEHLGPDGIGLLHQLGLFQLLENHDHLPCSMVRSCWGDESLAVQDYLLHPYGGGYNLTRPLFDESLAQLASVRGAVVFSASHAHDAELDPDGRWLVHISNGSTDSAIRARFVVDATARAAAIALRLGTSRTVHDRLIGIVGQCRCSAEASDGAVLVEAMSDGWWYSAPLSGGRMVATFMTDADLLGAGGKTPRGTWIERLSNTRYTRTRIADARTISEVLVRPAHTQTLSKVTGENWLAVGDAAIAFDPLSSSGISKSLDWGTRAAAVADRYLNADRAALPEYEDSIQTTFSRYIEDRVDHYRLEQRWPEMPFWRRRHQSPL